MIRHAVESHLLRAVGLLITAALAPVAVARRLHRPVVEVLVFPMV